MIWTPYDWLNKFYSFCVVSRHGLTIEAHRKNQPNKSKLALYKPLLHFYSQLKQLYISNKMECFSYKGECGIHGHMHIGMFKEELAWVTDKRLWVNSNIMSVIPLRN